MHFHPGTKYLSPFTYIFSLNSTVRSFSCVCYFFLRAFYNLIRLWMNSPVATGIWECICRHSWEISWSPSAWALPWHSWSSEASSLPLEVGDVPCTLLGCVAGHRFSPSSPESNLSNAVLSWNSPTWNSPWLSLSASLCQKCLQCTLTFHVLAAALCSLFISSCVLRLR